MNDKEQKQGLMKDSDTVFHVEEQVDPGRYIWLLMENTEGRNSHRRRSILRNGLRPSDHKGWVVGSTSINDPRSYWPICLEVYEHHESVVDGFIYDKERVERSAYDVLLQRYDVWRIDRLGLEEVKWRRWFIEGCDPSWENLYVCTDQWIPPHCLKLFRTRRYEVKRRIKEIEYGHVISKRWENRDLRPGHIERDPLYWLEEVGVGFRSVPLVSMVHFKAA